MFAARRRSLVARYNTALQDFPVKTPYVMEGADPSWHLYIVRINFANVTKTKQEIFAEMAPKGVALNLHYFPVHTQPYYEALGHRPEECPNVMDYYREALTLPLYPGLTDDEQDQVIEALREVLTA